MMMIHLNVFILSCQSLDLFDAFGYTSGILLYLITMAGFWLILFSMSCKLKGFLWTRALCIRGLPQLKGKPGQHLLLCGSVFDHVSLDLYWGTKVISQTQWCFLFITASVHCWTYWSSHGILGWTRFEFAALSLMPYYVKCCLKKANKT